ncbi:MAG: hypothetical protein RLZZ440_706 [Planctomycetota bacterium]
MPATRPLRIGLVGDACDPLTGRCLDGMVAYARFHDAISVVDLRTADKGDGQEPDELPAWLGEVDGIVRASLQGMPDQPLATWSRLLRVPTVSLHAGPIVGDLGDAKALVEESRLGEVLAPLPKPIGLLSLDDRIAKGIVFACQALGLAVPGDVAVVGVGDSPVARHAVPAIGCMAADFGVSRRTLERQFQRLVGHSPAEEIRRRRLDRAKELLNNQSVPIADVAGRVGFTAAAFSRFFRQQTGSTPREYRQASAERLLGRAAESPESDQP